jgi:hypothetical protein
MFVARKIVRAASATTLPTGRQDCTTTALSTD